MKHAASVVRRVGPLEIGGDSGHLVARRGHGRVRGKPTDHEDRMGRARQGLLRPLQWHPDIDIGPAALVGERPGVGGSRQDLEYPEVGVLSNHADDGVGHLIELQPPTQHILAIGEDPRQEPFIDDRDVGTTRAILIRQKGASPNHAHAEHRQQLVRHRQRGHPCRRPVLGDNRHLGAPQRAGDLDLPAARLKVDEVRERRWLACRTAVPVGLPDHEQAIHRVERHRPQQHRVDDAEDRGVRADPQGQRQDHRDRERGAAPEGANRVPEIGQHAGLPRPPTTLLAAPPSGRSSSPVALGGSRRPALRPAAVS